jgi:histidinol-phosphate aminotransferase
MEEETMLNIEQFASRAAKTGKLYNLDHFHIAWQNPGLRRMMGNELLFPPSPKVIQAVEEAIPLLNYYAEDPGTARDLRAALASYIGLEGSEDWITLGNGSMEIIDMIPRAFLDPGDEVLLPCPEYSPYTHRPLLFGAEIVDVLPSLEDFTYQLEDFTRHICERTKMVIITRPNAPVGNMVMRELIESLLAYPLVVLVDEAYTEFSRQSVCELLPRYPNLIISRTFSKAMGLAGIRLGFVAAQPDTIEWIERVRVPLNVGLITQVAALAALKDTDYIRACTEKVITARDYFTERIAQIDGLKAYPSQGNSVLIYCGASGKPAAVFVQRLEAVGYLVRDQSDSRGLAGDGFFRVTVGTQADMEAVADIIRTIAQE